MTFQSFRFVPAITTHFLGSLVILRRIVTDEKIPCISYILQFQLRQSFHFFTIIGGYMSRCLVALNCFFGTSQIQVVCSIWPCVPYNSIKMKMFTPARCKTPKIHRNENTQDVKNPRHFTSKCTTSHDI